MAAFIKHGNNNRSVILIIDLNEQQPALKGYKQTYLDYPTFFFEKIQMRLYRFKCTTRLSKLGL